MSKFKKGDKVRSIKDVNSWLTKDKVYIVTKPEEDYESLYVIADDGCEVIFYDSRFELADTFLVGEKVQCIGGEIHTNGEVLTVDRVNYYYFNHEDNENNYKRFVEFKVGDILAHNNGRIYLVENKTDEVVFNRQTKSYKKIGIFQLDENS